MNRNRTTWIVVVAIAAMAVCVIVVGTRRTVAAPAVPAATKEIPKFEVDPSWPKIPSGWKLGQAASAAGDEQDNIWILHRPLTVKPGVKTGPPVMEFDQAGNYIKGWGGPGKGYDWPKSEHGIYVDPKGYVWIGGQTDDDQIVKFTKDGKFVMQIGHGPSKRSNQDTTSFWKPTDVFVYAKTNELFVSDGYGNKRIIVFDADTGKFKRMWGAFGKVPADGPAHISIAQDFDTISDPKRTLATEFDPKDPGPPQFYMVHGVKVSNDGFVYAADRGEKRVQVFTIEGKFITQVWIDRWCEAAGYGCGIGQTAASVAFSADPAQRFLYVASRSPARVWVYDRKTLQPLYHFGEPGIAPGEFDVLHHMTTDSKGNLYTSEVEDGRRVQKFVFKGIVPMPAK